MASLAGIFFTVFLVIFFIANCQTQVNASDEILILKTESVNPGSFYYPIKRLWEKGVGLLQFDRQAKINYEKALLDIKLSELNFVVKHKFLSEVQKSTERFAYEAGILTDELIQEDNKTEKDVVIKKFAMYGSFLEKLRDEKYPKSSSFRMLIDHDIDTLKFLSNRLK